MKTKQILLGLILAVVLSGCVAYVPDTGYYQSYPYVTAPGAVIYAPAPPAVVFRWGCCWGGGHRSYGRRGR